MTTDLPLAPGCPLLSPQLVGSYRENVLTSWFVSYAKSNGKTLDSAAFLKALTDLQGAQLGATLANLSPVKDLIVWTVTLNVA